MDKYNHIEQLLEKYWAGVSSIEEEKALRNFFIQEKDLPLFLRAYADFFTGQQEESEMRLPDHFEEKILHKITSGSRRPMVIRYSFVFQIAACFIIAFGAIFFGYQYTEKKKSQAEARETVIEALSMITENLQKGENVVDEGLKQFEVLKYSQDKN